MKYIVKQNWFIVVLTLAIIFTGVILTSCKSGGTPKPERPFENNKWNN